MPSAPDNSCTRHSRINPMILNHQHTRRRVHLTSPDEIGDGAYTSSRSSRVAAAATGSGHRAAAWAANSRSQGGGCGSRAMIAHALGTSPDTARLRFDPESPVADSRWPREL